MFHTFRNGKGKSRVCGFMANNARFLFLFVLLTGTQLLSGQGKAEPKPADRIAGRPALAGEALSRYLGNANFIAVAIAVDSEGNAYVAGDNTGSGGLDRDIEIYKLNPQFEVAFKLTLGGSSYETVQAMELGEDGNLYLTGETLSDDFPLVRPVQAALSGGTEIFLTKVSPDGEILFSTFFGGSSADEGEVLVAGPEGMAYIGGRTGSGDFPATEGAYSTEFDSETPENNQLTDLVAIKIDTVAGSLVYATGLGGETSDDFNAAAVGPQGDLILLQKSTGTDFPVTDGSTRDGAGQRLARLSPDGSELVFGTYLDSVQFYDVVVDGDGNLLLSGWNLLVTLDGTTHAEIARVGTSKQFEQVTLDEEGRIVAESRDSVIRVSRNGFLRYEAALPVGAADAAVAPGPNGSIYYLGESGMVGRLFPDQGETEGLPPITGVANAGGFGVSSHLVPGEVLSLYGPGIGSDDPATAEIGNDGLVTTELGGVEVRFNGTPGRMLYSGPTQVNVSAPFAWGDGESVLLEVFHEGNVWASIALNPVDSEPVALLYEGRTAALNQDGTVNSRENRAEPGSVVTIYISGAGVMEGASYMDGEIFDASTPVGNLPTPVSPPVVEKNGESVEILYFGQAPGLLAGVVQMNLRLVDRPGRSSASEIYSLSADNFTSSFRIWVAEDAP